MVEQVDVPAGTSPAPEDLSPTPAAASSVTEGTDVVVEDRPLKNVQAEFNRKFGRVEQQLSDLALMVQQALQPKPTTPPASTGALDQYSDEQLAQLAQAGSAEAYQALTQRLVQKQVSAQVAQSNKTSEIQAVHAGLYTRYRQLNDSQHPLTQYAMRVKAALLQRGYPNTVETDVEAIKTAIVDNAGNPAVLVGPQAIEEPARRSGVQAQSAIDGAAGRRPQPSPQPGKAKLSPAELALAKRMGVTDPEGSKARFEKRQAEGRSALGAVGLHVREN